MRFKTLDDFDKEILSVISKGKVTFDDIKDQFSHISEQEIKESLRKLESKKLIVWENGEIKLTKKGYKEVKQKSVRELLPTSITNILNTIAIFLILVAMFMYLTSPNTLIITRKSMVLVGIDNFIILIILSIPAYFKPITSLIPAAFSIFFMIILLTGHSNIIGVGTAFYLILIATFLWISIPFISKKT